MPTGPFCVNWFYFKRPFFFFFLQSDRKEEQKRVIEKGPSQRKRWQRWKAASFRERVKENTAFTKGTVRWPWWWPIKGLTVGGVPIMEVGAAIWGLQHAKSHVPKRKNKSEGSHVSIVRTNPITLKKNKINNIHALLWNHCFSSWSSPTILHHVHTHLVGNVHPLSPSQTRLPMHN